MAWARLDDGFHDHPKVDGISLAAVGLYTLCLTWAHRHRKTAALPGHITEARVAKLAGKDAKKLSTELAKAGLWETETKLGGWVIHDFADYLPKERDPEERSASGRKGAASRWQSDSKPDGKLPSASMATDSSRASAPASPSRPVPNEDSSLGGERPVTLRPGNATKPPLKSPSDARCIGHKGVVDPGPCQGCRAEREQEERRAARASDQIAREAEARARACTDCDGTWVVDENKLPTRRRCDHTRRSA